MGWLERLFIHGSPKPRVADLDLGRLDLAGWTLVDRSGTDAHWRDADGRVLTLSWIWPPGGFPDLARPVALQKFARTFAESRQSGLVELAPVTGVNGDGFAFIYKCLRGTGFTFTAWLVHPRPDGAWAWVVKDGERGTTGIREAVITTQLFEAGLLTFESYEQTWARDPYDPGYHGVDRKTLRYTSDSEEYDGQFPDHPLSKVRCIVRALSKVCIEPATMRPARTQVTPDR